MLLSLGCGLKIGEKNKTENVAKIQSSECLEQSVEELKLFFKGDATDEQVASSIQCLQNVLLAFKDNIRGVNKEAYTPQEIAKVVREQFLKNGTAFRDEFLLEVMKFKVALVGGDDKLITKNEVEVISSIFARFKPDLIKLNPHMKIIVSNWAPEAASSTDNELKFIEAKKAFNSLLFNVAQWLASTGRGYDLSNLVNLAAEAALFAKSEDSSVQTIRNTKALIIKFKLTLIGGNKALQGQEWVSFLKSIVEAYFQSLRFKYFYNNLKAEQINEKAKVYENIAIDVSTLIQDLMTTKSMDLLTNKDIAEMLESAQPLFDNFNVNAQLIEQIGLIKTVFLGKQGGGSQAWSKSDFAALSAKAPLLLPHVALILGHLKNLKVNKEGYVKKEIKYEDFNISEAAVITAVSQISELIIESYDINAAKDLIQNLSQTILKDSLKLPDNFNDLVELAKSAKLMLTGQEGSGISKSNLQLLLNVGVRAYAHYIEYTNFIAPFKLEDQKFILSLVKLISKVEKTLSLELKLKATHMISTSEFAQLVLTAQDKKFITTKIKSASLDAALNALWSHWLNTPESRLAGEAQLGFNSVVLGRLATEMNIWLNNQKSITAAFDNKVELTKEELLKIIVPSDNSSSFEEFKKVLAAPGLMNFNDKGYLKILSNTNGAYRARDLSYSNLARMLSRLIIRSYAGDIKRVNDLTGITLDEVQITFSHLKNILFDLGLVDPESTTFIDSRFREANLFLAPSNGDNYASFTEIHHFALHILSGIERADSLKKIILEKCVASKNEDDVNKSLIAQDCLLDLYFNESASFQDLPAFLKMRKEAPQNGSLNTEFCAQDQNVESEDCKTLALNKAYFLGLLKAAGHIEPDDGPKTIILGDANLFPHVVQYVEMIYFTHDASRDGFLQKSEALNAYPVFAKTLLLLKTQFKEFEGNDFLGLFVWLLKKGQITPINTMKKFAKDHVCNLDPNPPAPCANDWTINSSRVELGKIFTLIAAFTKPTANIGQESVSIVLEY